ncbi:glycoside hydrolase family 127 protein [bacterium]|nr:glycoside hydrolase family 127 protein [bacterium]
MEKRYLREVPLKNVDIKDRFWAPRLDTLRKVTIPHLFKMLEKAGNINNFRLARDKAKEGYSGPYWMDSDLYKAIEAAAYVLAKYPDPDLEKQMDELISLIASAQMPDGYLNTYFEVVEPDKRWTNLMAAHELYCAGHLFEAAVAYYQATGKRNLLDVAIRFADHIDSIFGEAPGKRLGYPGHPEIELALVKLWKTTGEKRYLDLARFFILKRGSKFFAQEHNIPLDQYDGTNLQDNLPMKEQKEIVGHAVRAAYLMAGATDIGRETNDEELLQMVQRVWQNATEKRMFITGGIGSSSANEGFTTDYDLPNLTAYQETCASCAMVFWAQRLALLYGDAQYVDVLERALYNGALAGISLSGDRFFYVNPLESKGGYKREEWFGCACCPPNIARLIASIGNYIYAQSDEGIWVNLYVQSKANIELKSGNVQLEVIGDYPWDGHLLIFIHPSQPMEFPLNLRISGWCKEFEVRINGKLEEKPLVENGYIVLKRTWREGDKVELNLPMPVEKMVAHPNVKEDIGKIALQRGPLVYCFEAQDQTAPLGLIYLFIDGDFKARFESNLLGGIVVLDGEGMASDGVSWEKTLYQPAPSRVKKVNVRAIPYYAWCNREPREMKVWMPLYPPALWGM